MPGSAGRGGDLFPELAAQRVDLRAHPVLDVHPEQHGIVAQQHGGAEQHDTDRDQQHREPDRADAADDGREGRQSDATPDQGTRQTAALLLLGVALRHGRRCYPECYPS
ncbi:hypothetical protein [Pseudosporangium ferrugineum]|uniref:hypothetical protein n=1 Tax=Pseudosporangium ferrugineum TaxID=439699 RepID=UPI000D05A01A|nr:hypothetical protein [Pseudosporangium ferrugineum]